MVVKKATDLDVTNFEQEITMKDERNLYQRLAAAKKNFGSIVKTKVNPHFKSKFAPLEEIIEAVEPALTAEGLVLIGISQPMSNDAWVIGYRLQNIDNPDDKTEQTIPSKAYDPQKQGQAITYYRRYVLGLLLNLNIEDDDDGNAASDVGVSLSEKYPRNNNPAW